jgi:hypothetical protein
VSEPTYYIGPEGAWIQCLFCGLVSHNPNDVKERYCGKCHKFHQNPDMLRSVPTQVTVEGIVAQRDNQPYLMLTLGKERAQMSMAQARNIARDIERMCSRTEADAMLVNFFQKTLDSPPDAIAHLMVLFREFRSQLDAEPVETFQSEPGESVN